MADIFVSYTSSDRDWAFWIGQELERLRHLARLHEWQISTGGDISYQRRIAERPCWRTEGDGKENNLLGYGEIADLAEKLRPYYGLLHPCAPHRYSGSRGGFPLERLPSHRDDRFPRSATEPDPGSRRLQAGRRSGRTSGLRPNSSRQPLPSPRFRHRPVNFGTSSAVRLRSSLRISPDGIKPRLFCDPHHHRS